MPKDLRSLAERLATGTTLYFSRAMENLSFSDSAISWQIRGENSSISVDDVRRIVFTGRVNTDSGTIYEIMRHNLPIDWLDLQGCEVGQIYAAGAHIPEQKILAQTRFCAGEQSLDLSREIILAKVDNCQDILRRRAILPASWRECRAEVKAAASFPSLLGAEGNCARLYFSCFAAMLRPFDWPGRIPRHSPDPVNLMLSLGYSLIRQRLGSALRFYGLEPRIGFYHKGRGSHYALASDLMEPFRPLADNAVMTLCRRHEIKPEQFRSANGRCFMADRKAYPTIIGAFEKMFARIYGWQSPEGRVLRSLNDRLDDAAIGFGRLITDNTPYFPPRLCPGTC